jgi:hypothetical protein
MWEVRKERLVRIFEEWLRSGLDADGHHGARVFVQTLNDKARHGDPPELGPYED